MADTHLMYRKLLVPLDGSELAATVVPYVAKLANRLGSHVVLLQVVEPFVTAWREALPGEAMGAQVELAADVARKRVRAEHEAAERYLGQVQRHLQAEGVAASVAVVEGGPAEAILHYAGEQGADLIAMSTHGRGGLARLVFGSVADAVLRSAPCPLLLVRSREHRPEAGAGAATADSAG